MSGENKKQQGSVSSLVVYILAMAVSLGAYTLGCMARSGIKNGALYAFLCLGGLIVCMAASPIAASLYNKKLSATSVKRKNEDADERMARMAKDPDGEWRKLRRLCRLTEGYVAFLGLLCLGVCFFYGCSGLSTSWITVELLPMFFLTGYIGKFFRPKQKGNSEDALPEAEYPRLYGLVRSLGGEKLAGKKLYIRILQGIPDEECNAALAQSGKEITLWLGAVLLCVLDEEELTQVLLHEFAHMDKTDVDQERTYNRIMGYLQAEEHSVFGIMVELAMSFAILRLGLEGSFYFLFSSRAKEGRADHDAASLGDRQKQASALAKINAHTLFIYEQEPYDNLFVTEEIPQHLLTDRARNFRDALFNRGHFWRTILEREIPSRVDTHPTFRQRWEALGCCDYSMTPANVDSDFARECWAAAETADADRASIPQEQYDRMRKENYLDHLAVISEFESKEWNPSPEELRKPMLAYYHVGQPEKMEAICDRILAELDSPFSTAFSAYWKGTILLHRYDRQGLAYLYRAMETNTNYIEEGLSQIGRFCTMMGLEAELQEYRSRAPELMQLKVDRSTGGIHSGTKLIPASLPEGWLDKILDFALKAGEQKLDRIYLVQECVAEDYMPSSFILRFREEASDERRDEIYEKIFRLLDDWPEDYEFCLYIYEDSMEKLLSSVDGSCVYSCEA